MRASSIESPDSLARMAALRMSERLHARTVTPRAISVSMDCSEFAPGLSPAFEDGLRHVGSPVAGSLILFFSPYFSFYTSHR